MKSAVFSGVLVMTRKDGSQESVPLSVFIISEPERDVVACNHTTCERLPMLARRDATVGAIIDAARRLNRLPPLVSGGDLRSENDGAPVRPI